jgi:RND family efflux transporter MFP subunit
MRQPFIIIVCGVLVLATLGCSRSSSSGREARASGPALPVKFQQITPVQVRQSIDVVGTLAASDEVTVSAEVEGRVSRVHADLGDHVSAGQPLVELDSEKLRYAFEQQRAALARARAKYGVEEGKPLPAPESTPDVQKAAAEFTQARQARDRAAELERRSLLPAEQREAAEAKYESARAQYESSLQNAKNLAADIDAATAGVHLAERDLRDAMIRAPFEGYVAKRLVSLGEFLRVQTPVMAVVKLDPLKLTTEVPEKMAPWVRTGQKVELNVDAYPDRSLAGTITRISPAVNEQTRTFAVEATVPNRDGTLRPGTFARVRITSDKIDSVLRLPASAFQFRYGINRVFLLTKGDVVTAKEVLLGDRVGDDVEVTTALDSGARVAVSNVEKLSEGLRVAVDGTGEK